MKRETISQGIGNIDARYIQEAAYCFGKAEDSCRTESIRGAEGVSRSPDLNRKRHFMISAAAVLLVLCVLAGGILALFPASQGMVTVHARETDEEITAAGAVLHAGSISDTGKMKGHPLMFYLAGEDIASVRFSCKREQINFIDWTEKRDEYGNARNFTVPYGEDESEYYYLTIDWVPDMLIRELTDNGDSRIATLPEEMREDVIVMEITFENGKTATKAITVSLQDDGTFFATLEDYRISEADAFVRRPDSRAIPRDILYAQGAGAADGTGVNTSSSSADAPPMVCVGGRLYQRSAEQKYPYEGDEGGLVYLGKIESDVTRVPSEEGSNRNGAGTGTADGTETDAADRTGTYVSDGVPKEDFQANHPIVGAEVYGYGDDLMIRIGGEYWLYEAVGGGETQSGQKGMFENVGGIACWGISLSAENVTSAGLTLVCAQAGGLPIGELQTGKFYKLAVKEGDAWKEVPCLVENAVWTAEAYRIPMDDTVYWEIDWETLYGKLNAGTYRIMKRIDDFRKTGDYDTEECWAEFEIEPQQEPSLTEEQIQKAKQSALSYYAGTVFSVNSIEYTEDKKPYEDEEGSCSFIVNVSKGGVVQEPDRRITLKLEDGQWKVTNEGY